MDLFIIGVEQGQDFDVVNRDPGPRTDRSELVRFGPEVQGIITEPLGTGQTGFGSWIPCLEEDLEKMSGRFG